MAPTPFDVRNERLEDGIRAITVSGELDMNTAPQLERELDGIDAGGDPMVMIDLGRCEFIDSTGIALIVRSWRRIDRAAGGEGEGEGRLVLCSRNHQVRRLLEITGVETSISIHEQRDAALAELRGA